MDQIEQLFGRLDGTGSAAERELVDEARRLCGDDLPRRLLAYFRTATRGQQRLACVYYAQPYARWSDAALQIGIEGAEDRSKMVRFRAFELLALAQKQQALPALQRILEKAPDQTTAEDAKACRCAILAQNHNCFRDRGCTGKVFYEWMEIMPGGEERVVVAGPCSRDVCRPCDRIGRG